MACFGWFIVYILGWIAAYAIISRVVTAYMLDKGEKWDDYDRKGCCIVAIFSWGSVILALVVWAYCVFDSKYGNPLKLLEPKQAKKKDEA